MTEDKAGLDTKGQESDADRLMRIIEQHAGEPDFLNSLFGWTDRREVQRLRAKVAELEASLGALRAAHLNCPSFVPANIAAQARREEM